MPLRGCSRHQGPSWSMLPQKHGFGDAPSTTEWFIYKALRRVDVPAVKEPSGLIRSDGKRPDGLTLIPWQGGSCLCWDVTVTDSLASSYIGAGSKCGRFSCRRCRIPQTSQVCQHSVNTYFCSCCCRNTGAPLCRSLHIPSGTGTTLECMHRWSERVLFFVPASFYADSALQCCCLQGFIRRRHITRRQFTSAG